MSDLGVNTVRLKKEVTLFNGVTLIVGNIIASGIFVSPLSVFYHTNSIGITLTTYIISGVLSTFGAACYAELGTTIDRSGGEYSYILEIFGRLPAFLYLWTKLFIIPVELAIYATTFIIFFNKAFFPYGWTNEITRHFAALSVCVLTALNCLSVRLSLLLQDLTTIGKIVGLFVIIIAGVIRGSSERFTDAFGGDCDIGRLALACYSGLFYYNGWNTLSYVTEEVRDSHRNIPRAVWISMPLVIILYFCTNVSYFAALSTDEIFQSQSIAETFSDKVFQTWSWVIPSFITASALGTLNGCIFISARVVTVASEEGHLPKRLSSINVRRHTPISALIFTCVISIFMLYFSNLFAIINYFILIELISTAACITGLLYIRSSRPAMPRYLIVDQSLPIVFIATLCIAIIVCLIVQPIEGCIGLLITLTGVPVYYLIFRKKEILSIQKSLRHAKR